MRIAIDAMGGDYAPREIVAGAVDAAQNLDDNYRLQLFGDETAIRAELARCGVPNHPRIAVIHASEIIGMDESPAVAVRRKRDSSINRAMDQLRDGKSDAFVSAGNTGAVVAAATLKLRLIAGVNRPAIATVMPTRKRPLLLLDAGANTDCDVELLRQFAVMGSVFSEAVLQQPSPVVGLLSIGGESIKGNDATRKAYARFDAMKSIRFRGNVEGHDLFIGETDVVVCDGFVGNVVLKTTESVAHAIGFWMKEEFRRTPLRIMGALLLRGALKTMKERLDPELYGGAPLLGVRGTCIISHGSSSRRAIFNAIRVAGESLCHQVNGLIETKLASEN